MDQLDITQIELEREHERAILANKNKLADSGIIHCIDCDIKIPEARKKAVPSAKRCMDCEELEGSRYV